MVLMVQDLLDRERKVLEETKGKVYTQHNIQMLNKVEGRIEILEKFLELPDKYEQHHQSIVQKIADGAKKFAKPIYKTFLDRGSV